MKLIRCKKHHRSRSRRRKSSCSEESILTDEEIYEYKSRLKKPCRYAPETPTRERRRAREWESCENIHFPYECECCPRNCRKHIYKRSGSEIPREFITTEPEATTRRPDMPMVKRYLPMYQTPELIEELKRHDRMKLIQEKEKKKHRSPFRCLDSSTSSRMETQRINPSLASEHSVSY